MPTNAVRITVQVHDGEYATGPPLLYHPHPAGLPLTPGHPHSHPPGQPQPGLAFPYYGPLEYFNPYYFPSYATAGAASEYQIQPGAAAGTGHHAAAGPVHHAQPHQLLGNH